MSWKTLFLSTTFIPLFLCAQEVCCPPFALMASARPCPDSRKECTGMPIASASFLLWQAKIWGLEFAGKSLLPSSGGTNIELEQKLFVPDFSWRPGVKVNLGYNLPFDGWDLMSNWTYYHNEFTSLKKHFNSLNHDSLGVIPYWRHPFFDSAGAQLVFASAAANGKLFFNAVHLEVGRSSFLHNSFPFRLQVGITGEWLHQYYHVLYEDGTPIRDINNGSTVTLSSSRFTYANHQWGIGPRGGFDGKWIVGRGFSLIANSSLSLLCSFFEIGQKYRDVGTASFSMKMSEHFREITPFWEALMGLNWASCYGRCHPLYVDWTLGFEWHYLFGVNHVRRNYVEALPGETFDMRGDVQMHGLTTTVKIEF